MNAENKKEVKLAEKKRKAEQKIINKEREQYHKEVIAREKLRESEPRVAPEGAFLSLVNVNKIYPNHVQAVFDFNLDIKENEFIVLVGPSGCGKSTTLRMIAGLENITAGDLYIEGKYSNDVMPKDRGIAMVFQSYALYPQMTVYENMSFGLKINHYPKEEIRERVMKAAEILQLEEYLDRKPGALSGGQCQRVALGRAIVRNSKLFLMDEPLSNLDAKLRVAMRSEIVRLHQRLGATTIYVTHDQTEAMTMATRIVVMNKGYIQQIGSPSEIYSNPSNLFVATFIGSPAMNIYDIRFENNLVKFKNGTTIDLGKDFVKRIQKFYKEEAAKIDAKIEKDKNKYFARFVADLKNGFDGDVEAKKQELFDANLAINVELQEMMNNRNKLFELSTKTEFDLKLGIRPENLMAVKPTKSNPSYKVVVPELLGSEYFLHFDFSSDEEIVVKASADKPIEVGTELGIEFNNEKVYIFDPLTTNKIN